MKKVIIAKVYFEDHITTINLNDIAFKGNKCIFLSKIGLVFSNPLGIERIDFIEEICDD